MTIKQIISTYIPKQQKVQIVGNVILFEVDAKNIKDICKKLYKDFHLSLKTAYATDERKEDNTYNIYYVFGIPQENIFLVPFIRLQDTTEFPSLVSVMHKISSFEREIYTFFGLTPVGHPKLTRILLHDNWPGSYPLRKDFAWNTRPAMSKKQHDTFGVVQGEGIYEIPVGPIHAGIIEPGHFRFSVAGEEIVSLELQLGYVHKGIEKLFEILPLPEKIRLSERVSGDSSVSHSLAFCQALESLADIQVPTRAKYLRVVFAELERLANHFNDFAFIMNDTAFTFGGSQGTRLREVIMQINEKLTGSRYIRGVIVEGGVSIDISKENKKELLEGIQNIVKDFTEVLDVCLDSTSMVNRLKGSGVLQKQAALDHGVVGVAARALGIPRDARIEYPYAAYPDLDIKIALRETGDVYARFGVRVDEIYASMQIIKQAIEKMPSGSIQTKGKSFAKQSVAVGITEGWRGEIVYIVMTDESGEISRVTVKDPSRLNWAVVPHAVVGNPVPEFPLINKSFNLSYSGNDK